METLEIIAIVVGMLADTLMSASIVVKWLADHKDDNQPQS